MGTIEFLPEEELKEVQEGLRAYNRAYFKDVGDLSCRVRDGAGRTVAGALAWRAEDLVMLDVLWVDEAHRREGLGARLLAALEAEGRRQGARRLELNTFGFQAPGFYEKQGYRLVGKVEPCIGPHGHYHYIKEL